LKFSQINVLFARITLSGYEKDARGSRNQKFTNAVMNLLDRINDKLTSKNKLVAERPPVSDLILLLGKKEMEVAKSMWYSSFPTRGHAVVIDENLGKALKTIGGQKCLFEMLVIPVDFEEYLDIVQKL
jgi:hypothetical protein